MSLWIDEKPYIVCGNSEITPLAFINFAVTLVDLKSLELPSTLR